MHVIAQNLISGRFTPGECVLLRSRVSPENTKRLQLVKGEFSLFPSEPVTPNQTKRRQLYGLTSVRVLHEINIAFLGKSLDI